MKTLKLKEWSHHATIGRSSAILLIAAAMQTLSLPTLQAATPQKEITDSGITSVIEGGLAHEKGVVPDDVDVNTSQGIVTVSGSVDNLLAKRRAVKIAESIRGVLGVIDRIIVTPVSPPDEDIRKDILAALLQDPATESYQVAVGVQDAVATLTGGVGSYGEKQLAARLAEGVKGVKEVDNNVTINYLANRTDPEIAADVKARLQWDIWMNGSVINSVVKDGKVTLTGTIGSAISEDRALDDAWVNGVTSVNYSGLKVDPQTHSVTHQEVTDATRPDSEIKLAVQASLHLDPRVSTFSPDVTVEGGMVVLGGNVGNLKAKTSAAQDALNIVGVEGVDNFLKVRPKGRPTDAEMGNELKAALFWDPMVDSSTITVAVINRVAYLSGGVDSGFEKNEAQDVASRIKGVLLIRNHLKVEPEHLISDYDYADYSAYSGYYGWPYYNDQPTELEMVGPRPTWSDERIKKNIEDKFFWSPFVDRDDIKVTVNGAVATLTGTVETWVGWNEADKDAHKSGATAVLDQIKVKKHWL